MAEQEHSVKINSKDHDVITTPMLEAEGDKLMNKDTNAYNCNQCEYSSATKMSLIKHINTKHALNPVKQVVTEQVVVPSCSLCDDNFNTVEEYEEHVQEHKDEIEEIDVTALTNGLELFECNLCSFESGHEDSIKEHLLYHVNLPSNASEKKTKNNAKLEALQSGNLLDLYDDDGNPLYDSTDSEYSDSE